MNLLQTHLLMEQQDQEEIQTPNSSISKGLHAGKFWEGANLMGIINTVGGTWSQIEQARKGKPVYVQNGSGKTQDIAPMLMAKLEQQANAQQTSTDNLFKMMQLQMQAQQPPKEDNTMLYVGLGVGAVVLLGGMYMITKK